MDFKVGDVVYVDDYSYENDWVETDRTATIYHIEEDSTWAGGFAVSFHKDKEPHRCIAGLRHMRIRDNRLARKLYPNWRPKDGWLYQKIP